METIKQMTWIETGNAGTGNGTAYGIAMSCGGHASDAFQGAALSGDVRDRRAAERVLGHATTTFPGPDAWSPPT